MSALTDTLPRWRNLLPATAIAIACLLPQGGVASAAVHDAASMLHEIPGGTPDAEIVEEAGGKKKNGTYQKFFTGKCDSGLAICTYKVMKVPAGKRLVVTDVSCLAIADGRLVATALANETAKGKTLAAYLPHTTTIDGPNLFYSVINERTRFTATAGDTVKLTLVAEDFFQAINCYVTGDITSLKK